MRELVAQRLYGLCSGYEDLNDHDRLRHDLLLQTAAGKASELASSPTLSRLETRVSRADIIALSRHRRRQARGGGDQAAGLVPPPMRATFLTAARALAP